MIRCWMSLAALASSPVWSRGIAGQVTGIDITPAMIEEAQKRQQAMGLANMAWKVGDVLPLPFPGSSFSAVITRYSFHHFLDPEAVLTEMVRVCHPGGRVAVVDVFMSTPEQSEAYDRMEKLRDPSILGHCSWRN